MVDRTLSIWREGHKAVKLLMDIKAAFLTVERGSLIKAMRVKRSNGDLICKMATILRVHRVPMLIEVNIVRSHLAEIGIPQGSLESLILFTIVISGIMKWVDQKVTGVEGFSMVGNIGYVASGSDIYEIVKNLNAWARGSIYQMEKRRLEIDTAIT